MTEYINSRLAEWAREFKRRPLSNLVAILIQRAIDPFPCWRNRLSEQLLRVFLEDREPITWRELSPWYQEPTQSWGDQDES